MRRTSATVGRALRARPVAVAFALALVLLRVLSHPLFGPHRTVEQYFGTGYEPLLEQGHWWSPVTGVFFADSGFEFVTAVVLAIIVLGEAERLMGALRTVAALLVTPIAGVLAGVGLQALGNSRGELWSRRVAELMALDPLTAIAGALMAASGFASVLWRRRIRLIVLLVCLVFLLYSGQPADLYRLMAAFAGLLLGTLLRSRKRILSWTRSSHHEVRVLMASIVAITAVGPTIALLASSRYGPLAPVALLLGNDMPDVNTVLGRCEALDVTRGCLRELTLERISNPGAVLVSIFPLVVLLLAAYGLLHGRRFAVWLAAAINVMLALLTAFYFGLLPLFGLPFEIRPAASNYWEVSFALSLSVLMPLAIAGCLVGLRRHFPVLAPGRTVTRYVLSVLIAGVGLAALYLAVGWLFRDSAFTRSVNAGDLLADVTERFIPVSFLRREALDFLPASPIGDLLYHGVGPLFWAVVIVAAIRPLFSARAGERPVGAERIRTLLRNGSDSLGFMATWPGNTYWFDPVQERAVAYRVIGRVALTLGAPLGTAGPVSATLGRFARFCDDNGWLPVFYSVPSSLGADFTAMGWETMVVAEESVIHLEGWHTTGKKWQDVRTAIHRAGRENVTAVWTSYAALSLATAVQIAELSEQWVAEKNLPEMGFTLGGLDELRDPDVRLMLAVNADGRVDGVTSWLPCYRHGEIVGWTLDFMRRRAGSMNGVMEFLIAQAAERMRDDGIEFLSLSAAPLAHPHSPAPERSGQQQRATVYRALERLSSLLEPVYGFQSLLNFKRKFQPEFRPLLMAYPDPVGLPAIGVALVRAYLPELSVREATGLLRAR